MSTNPYDIAISCFARDGAFARDLSNRLTKEGLNVFFYERAQDEVTGSNGDEKFRKPFREALVSVVLLRVGYGERGWTGLEKVAIVEAAVEVAYKNLFVVRMEAMPTPGWVPATNIYFNIEAFPVEQLIGAIKMKVVELGGRPQPITAERRAELHVATQKFEADRQYFRTDGRHFPQFAAEVAALNQFITEKCASLAAKGIEIEVVANGGRCVMRNSTASVIVFWRPSGFGRVDHEEIVVEEYTARMDIPGERLIWLEGRPKPTRTERYDLELTPARTLAWKLQNEESLLSSQVLADQIVVRFFELADKVTQDRNRRKGSGWL